jgi:hypothetical protein
MANSSKADEIQGLKTVQSDISDFGFEMQDSSNFKIPSRLSARFVKYVGTLS